MGRAIAVLLAMSASAAARAEAAGPERGTFFLLELQGGVSGPAFEGGAFGPAYGLSAGLTFTLRPTPLRLYVLSTVGGRNLSSTGLLGGRSASSQSQGIDWYGGARLVLPIPGHLRLFVEGGVGHRWWVSSLEPTEPGTLAGLNLSDRAALVVLGAGIEARLTRSLSLGLRWELTSTPWTGPEVRGLSRDPSQHAVLAQLGWHF